VPTPIDARRVAIAALADELVADPSLLRAYGTAFDADDDVTLVIYSDAAPDQVAERLGPVIAAADLEGPRAPDLLAVLGAAPQEAAVAARSTALLSRRAPTGPLATLPRFDDARVAELRTLAVGTPMHALYGQFVRSGDVVFDVGANLGTRSEVFLDLGARVVAVEPQAPLAAQLRDRWAAESRFRLVEGGLGAAEGTAELFLSDAHPITSMSREFIEATTASGRFAAQRWDDVAVVDITTLDRLIDAHGVPAFVKIDVEGFEHEVLCGLSRPVGAASIEFASETVATSTARCIERFAELGMTEFNLSLGESMAWHLPRWVDRDTILAVLRELPGELPWGDVYARLPVAGDFEVPADMAWAFGPDGFYEQDVTMWFDRLMERSGAKVVYDVGANCGWFAVRAAQAGAAVRAFEPVPGTADVLERNLRGTADTRIVRAAVGREPGTALMHLYSSSGNNSLVERTLPPGHPLRHTGRHEVEIVCLDDVVGTDGFPAPELVKIDVEGFELAVLQGARETLRRHQPALLLEWSTATCRDAGYDRGELVTELSGLGYDVWAISAHGQLVDPAMAGEDAETLVAAAPGVALRAPAAAPASPEQQFLADLEAYRAMPGAEAVRDEDLNPQLHDRLPTTPYDQHYFFQDTWAARRVADLRPARHVDVGSRIDLVAFLTAICPVTFVDIRPLEVELEDFESLAGSILDLPFADQTLASLSCLHVAEHIGLGRYGDPLDPHGTRKAAAELQRVLAVGGQLLFSGPVGRARTCFNAHRVHDPRVVVEEYFPELELVEFSGVDDAGVFRRHRSVEEFVGASYACGMFRFVRPED
jgi:FkbM family methyltransferase